MTDDLDLLVERYLAGSAQPEDVRRLGDLLRRDAEALRRFVLAIGEDAWLRRLSSEAPSPAVPERRRATRRATYRRLSRGNRPTWLTATLVAAGALIVLALAFALSPSSPSPEKSAGKRGTPVPDPPVASSPEPEALRPLENRIQEIERERQKLVTVRDHAREDEARRRAEAELEKIAADYRAAVARLEEERRRAQASTPEKPPAREPPRPPTVATVATIDPVDGQVEVVAADGSRTPARPGQALLAGQGLLSVGADGVARLAFGDGTRVELGGDSEIRDVQDQEAVGKGARGKRLFVAKGRISAEVRKQAADRPMVFVTPHGEATVLGTTLRIVVDTTGTGSTRLDVIEGVVRLKRLADGKPVDVAGGHTAVAAVGVELSSKPLPIENILLTIKDGRWGGDWRRVDDAGASTGAALEAEGPKNADSPGRIKAQTLGYVEFTFSADARKDYFIWIRGFSPGIQSYNAIALYSPLAQFNPLDSELSRVAGLSLSLFSDFSVQGYTWIGGGAPQGAGGAEKNGGPTTVRFTQSGKQRLRIYPIDTSVRMDALWLSATQKTRPAAHEHGPRAAAK